jgi:CheY-like chemotaxis protein/Tfp pilus assembly protein PilZ
MKGDDPHSAVGKGDQPRLQVEYPDLQAFLLDYRQNISQGSTFVSSQREWQVGDAVELVLTFPGLLENIVLPGRIEWVRIGRDPGVGIQIAFDEQPEVKGKLVQIARSIEAGDPSIVSPRIRVLVAEDNPILCNMLIDGLHRQASRCAAMDSVFVFHHANDGAAAMAIIEKEPLDLLVVDVFLPVLGGDHIIRTARDLFGVQFPIIAISGGGPEAAKTAAEAGADVFLPKPLRLVKVFDAMVQLLGLDLDQ